MNAQLTSTARRFALTLGVAGIAALGSVAAAPAALAAPAAASVQADDSGPDMFLPGLRENGQHGVRPVFFCDDENVNKQHNNCVDVTSSVRF